MRFKVDQADCLRKGIDCKRSIITLEVDPGQLDQRARNLLADRLVEGIDVCQLDLEGAVEFVNKFGLDLDLAIERGLAKPRLIQADEPTLEALIAACEANEPKARLAEAEAELKRLGEGRPS